MIYLLVISQINYKFTLQAYIYNAYYLKFAI